jgi:hypothetical protein
MNFRSSYPSLPNLLVIGAHKCGTTSLHYYLSLHPQIGMSRKKELNFFADEAVWSRGLAWYSSQFDSCKNLRGESSTRYTCYPEFGIPAERIQQLLPDARLIYLVRDPVERIVSHYIFHVDMGWELRSFAEALSDLENNPYLLRSSYALQLEQYYSRFPREQILVVHSEDLKKKRRETLHRIFRFLGADENFFSVQFFLRLNSSWVKRSPRPAAKRFPLPGGERLKRISMPLYAAADRLWQFPFSKPLPRPELPTGQWQRIESYLAPQVEGLRQLTGMSFPGWFRREK